MGHATAENITRRSLTLAGLGAFVGAAVPAGAASCAVPSLLEQWNEHKRLMSLFAAASERSDAADAEFENSMLALPEELIVTDFDRAMFHEAWFVINVGRLCDDGKHRYTESVIRRLRNRHGPFGAGYDEHGRITRCNAKHEQRVTEIAAAWDRLPAGRVPSTEAKLRAEEEQVDAFEVLLEHDLKLMAFPAVNFADIAIKAQVVGDERELRDDVDALVDILLDDIDALAPQFAGAASA